jgi:uncharacterized protein (DUF362 family)
MTRREQDMDRPPQEDRGLHDWPAARVNRGQFLQMAGAMAAGAALAGCGAGGAAGPAPAPSSASPTAPSSPPPSETQPPASATGHAYLAVAKGKDPAAITRAALEAIGGIQRFVARGGDVIIKPNICVGYHPPEYAATTNPVVVATLVTLCREAGAGRVRVMDSPFGSPASTAYDVSGIAAAVRKAGGVMEIMSPLGFVDTPIPHGKAITHYPIYGDILKADVVINVPIAKQHSLSRLTLGGKNLMGCVTDRQNLHFNLGQCIADLTSVIRPELTVIDAVRILVSNGPTGGSLSDVRRKDTVIASADIVAADSYAATLFGLTAAEVPSIDASARMGLGRARLQGLRIARVTA